MTLILFIPHKEGALLISDRLNSLYSGQKMEVDKIHQLSKDTVIGFSGDTEICKYIVDVIKKAQETSDSKIGEIIRKKKYELNKETGKTDDVEFILVQNKENKIKVWKLLNGILNEENFQEIQAIGLFQSIIPHLKTDTLSRSLDEALQLGVDLIGWVNSIESSVGDPKVQGCNIYYINTKRMSSEIKRVSTNLQRFDYRFSDEVVTYTRPVLDGTITLGYISSTTSGLETAIPHIKQIIEPDLNAYARKLGYNVRFEFLIDDAAGQAAIHLEKVQGLKSMGVNIIIGGGWSSQAAAALEYVNKNNMLLFSSSSTSPLLAISNDNFYRMCPDDTIQAPAMSRMIQSMGVKYVICIQRGDAWADGIWNAFQPHFETNGGVMLERIRYAGEATEFADYLQQAEDKLAPAVAQYGLDACGIVVIAFQEAVTIVSQAEGFPNIYSVKWFGSDGTSLTQQFLDDAPTQSTHLKIYSTLAAPAESSKFTALYDRYFALVSQPYGYYTACTYDTAWVIVKAILETQSTDPSIIIPLLKSITNDYFGASGWCQLNEAGDRAVSNYQIWGYGDIGSGPQMVVYGLYDAITDDVNWNTKYLGFTPKPR